MSEENFLERWSRRKRAEANEEDERQEQSVLPPEAAGAASDAGPGPDAKAPEQNKPAGEEEPVFDLSRLPSIESITATTDIRMFMLPGVPMALRQAALQKVWVTDPKIRDFIEMAENQWDFTVNSPGFDFSAPAGDVKKLVAEILGKSPEEQEAEPKSAVTDETPVVGGDAAGGEEISATDSVRLSAAGGESGNRNQIPEPAPAELDTGTAANENSADVASQNFNAAQKEFPVGVTKRRHGSALPG